MRTTPTIVAPATPPGVGGLAVVRLSGPESPRILKQLDSRHRILPTHRATHLHVVDTSGEIIDDAVAVYFQAPHSYTGEDVVEISCHGSPLVVQKLVHLICDLGARLAEPGEFTRRAFLNGKMDLIQAEAVAAFIGAQTSESSRLNRRLLQGRLSTQIGHLKKRLVTALGQIEYVLDISEEEIGADLVPRLTADLTDLEQEGRALLSSYRWGQLLNEGAVVALAGPPNSGKSTLFNYLLQDDRAITSPVPGTTRDYISANFHLEGIPLQLMDTAGLRSSSDQIEKAGIDKTRSLIDSCDIVLWIQDVNHPTDEDPGESIAVPVLKIFNKIDLLPSKPNSFQAKSQGQEIYISALTGEGVPELLEEMKGLLIRDQGPERSVALATIRQFETMQQFVQPLEKSLHLLRQNPPPLELISFELREALNALDLLLGKTTPDEILNTIFREFCVGK
ncbi:MAG: tRNA uridine-5-carboxymethylaminomethyl(34) synthesis GTPase MnmE [Candidatus Neomarinimicrobiota bacterium]|nr:MAG: tRNA uridine-5-carboxymethylaminomethyl(34) synthesis GTPase MnmE [Candidatus Neomarinimicrobiota bacterium]